MRFLPSKYNTGKESKTERLLPKASVFLIVPRALLGHADEVIGWLEGARQSWRDQQVKVQPKPGVASDS
jgi:hypothetical protein